MRFSAAGFIDDLDVHKLRVPPFYFASPDFNVYLCSIPFVGFFKLTSQELSLPSRTDPAWLVEAIAEGCSGSYRLSDSYDIYGRS